MALQFTPACHSSRFSIISEGRVALENQSSAEVEILLTLRRSRALFFAESEDALVGAALLMPYKLEIDFPERTVFIEIED